MKNRKKGPELIILGSGSAFPSGDPRKVRNSAGYAVRIGSRTILFDLGFGDLRQMARAGLDPAEVTDVFFSHRHPDHVGDLAALLFFFKYERPPKSGTLGIYGPPGITSLVRQVSKAYSPWLVPKGYKLSVRSLKNEEAILDLDNEWVVTARKARHNTPALSYRLTVWKNTPRRRTFVYSGDTGWDPGLAGFARRCDLFLLEATLGDKERHDWHLTARQSVALAALSSCRRAVFTHVSPESLADIKKHIKRGKKFGLAEDLMRIAF